MNGIGHIWGMGMGLGLGWIIGLIILAVIIWLIVKLVFQHNNLNLQNNKSLLHILKKRYVRGKIGKKEFERKRKEIL